MKILKICMAVIFLAKVNTASTVKNRYSYSLPENWSVVDSNITDSTEMRLYLIKTDTIDNKPHHSNAFIKALPIADTININKHGHAFAARVAKNMRYLVSAQDGDNWRTYLFLGKSENQEYIAMYRLGMYKNICVEFFLAFPHFGKGNTSAFILTLNKDYVIGKGMAGAYCRYEDVKEFMDMFNIVSSGLYIDNKNRYRAYVEIVEKDRETMRFKDSTIKKQE
jgi:hypothetical protein